MHSFDAIGTVAANTSARGSNCCLLIAFLQLLHEDVESADHKKKKSKEKSLRQEKQGVNKKAWIDYL